MRDAVLVGIGIAGALTVVMMWNLWRGPTDAAPAEPDEAAAATNSVEEVVEVPPEILGRAAIESVPVRVEPMVDRLRVTGTIRANQERLQQMAPLVSGRIDRMIVVLGDRVRMRRRSNSGAASTRWAIARYGLNVEDVNALIAAIAAGEDAGVVYQGERRFGLVVRFEEDAGDSIENIRNLVVPAPNGARVPVSQLADVTLSQGPAQISRMTPGAASPSSSTCGTAISRAS